MATIDDEGTIIGSVEEWVNRIVWFNKTLRFDSVNFWPSGDDEIRQVRVFAEGVIPKVKERLSVQRE